MPTIGGIIIFAAIIFSFALWFPGPGQLKLPDLGYKAMYSSMGLYYKQFKFVIAAMVLLFFIGVEDASRVPATVT